MQHGCPATRERGSTLHMKQAKIPPRDNGKSVHDWEQFHKRAEPTRAACAKVRAALAAACEKQPKKGKRK